MKSFTTLTDACFGSQSGSTRTPSSTPSPIFQKIQNRFHSLYDGTCEYSQRRPGRDFVVIVGGLAEPRRRALEHEQLTDDARDLGDELHRARAGADHRDAPRRSTLSSQRGVERRARERVAAGDVGVERAVQLTDRADHRVRVDLLLVAARVARHDRPRQVGVRPRGRDDLGREPDVLAQAEDVGAAAEVVEQHVLGGEVERPVVALRERVAVVVVRVVDAAAGIGVLEPRTADVVVLLDDHERHAGLQEPVAGEQARHAGTDHDDLERHVGSDVGLVPSRRATILASERELFFEQRQVGAPCRRRRPRTP